MADDANAFAFEPTEAPDNCIILAEFAIPGEGDEIIDQGSNIVETMGPIRVAGHLGLLPRGELGIELFECLRRFGFQPGDFLADSGCAVACLKRAQLVDLGLDFGHRLFKIEIAAHVVSRFRSLQALAVPLMRTSESKAHYELYDSSAGLDLKFLEELAARLIGTSNPPH